MDCCAYRLQLADRGERIAEATRCGEVITEASFMRWGSGAGCGYRRRRRATCRSRRRWSMRMPDPTGWAEFHEVMIAMPVVAATIRIGTARLIGISKSLIPSSGEVSPGSVSGLAHHLWRMQRNPRWEVPVSTGWAIRAGRSVAAAVVGCA